MWISSKETKNNMSIKSGRKVNRHSYQISYQNIAEHLVMTHRLPSSKFRRFIEWNRDDILIKNIYSSIRCTFMNISLQPYLQLMLSMKRNRLFPSELCQRKTTVKQEVLTTSPELWLFWKDSIKCGVNLVCCRNRNKSVDIH